MQKWNKSKKLITPIEQPYVVCSALIQIILFFRFINCLTKINGVFINLKFGWYW